MKPTLENFEANYFTTLVTTYLKKSYFIQMNNFSLRYGIKNYVFYFTVFDCCSIRTNKENDAFSRYFDAAQSINIFKMTYI